MLAQRAARALLWLDVRIRRCFVDDRVKGEMKKAEGKVKEEFGKAVGDRSTEWGGKVDQAKGELQKRAGELQQEGRRDEGQPDAMRKAEGKAKEEFGKAVGDRSTGWADQVKAEVQKKAGDIEREGRREEGIDEPASR